LIYPKEAHISRGGAKKRENGTPAGDAKSSSKKGGYRKEAREEGGFIIPLLANFLRA